MKRVRRLITVDDAQGKSRAIADAPIADIREDAEQPGVFSSVVWVTDRTPARMASEMPRIERVFAPPPGGSVCRIVTFPPDRGVRPPMRKMRSLDLCLVLEGEITLVLDLEEVHLRAGDVVVQRGTRHAWCNRSSRPCVIAISAHDAVEEASNA